MRGQRGLEGVHTDTLLSGGRTDISAGAVLDNDPNGRVLALAGAVGDATEGHYVGAAGLNVPELVAAAVRRRLDAFRID